MTATRRALAVVLAAMWAVTGCGPIWAAGAISRASTAVDDARKAGAEEQAPYEFTKAQMYLRYAREAVSRSDHEAAQTFGDEAARLATAARENGPKLARERELRQKAARPAAVPASPVAPGTPATPGGVAPGGGR
jgi:hypothetical protein